MESCNVSLDAKDDSVEDDEIKVRRGVTAGIKSANDSNKPITPSSIVLVDKNE